MYQSQKGLAQFLIPRGDTSKLFEIVEEPFYLLTELVEVFIPTATLLEHTVQTQGFMGVSEAAFPLYL